MGRPQNYRSHGTLGPVEIALRRLCERGWSDRQISAALSDLPERDIELMERHGLWNWRDVEGSLRPGGGRPWTRRQVEYHRRRLGLPGQRQRHEAGSLARQRQVRSMSFAALRGWGHLVGRDAELRQLFVTHTYLELPAVAAAVGWPAGVVLGWCRCPWDELRPTDVLVLTALDLFGPQDRAGLKTSIATLWHRYRHDLGCGRQRRRRPKQPPALNHTWNHSWLGRLLERGLVRVLSLRQGAGRHRRVYALAHGLTRHERTPFKTSLERLAQKMGWGQA